MNVGMKLHAAEHHQVGTTLCGRPAGRVLTLAPIHWHRVDCKKCQQAMDAFAEPSDTVSAGGRIA